jgi:hypothetical protein
MEALLMKPSKPLLALLGVVLAASTATAAVQFQGLPYTPHGACAVDVGADGMLTLSNIGSSGQDGVSIPWPRSSGARMVLAGTTSVAGSGGSSVSLSHVVSLNGLPPGQPVYRSMSVSFSVSSNACVCACDFSQVSSSSSVTVTLYRFGRPVYSTAVSSLLTSVQMPFSLMGASCPNPALSCSRGGKSSPQLCNVRCSFPSSVSVSLDGQALECDEVSFSCTSDLDCDGFSDEMRVVAPPGSSLSTVRCSDGSCRLFDHWLSCAGTASLDLDAFASSNGRRLPVHNLGSSGNDGVEIKMSSRVAASGGGGGGGGFLSSLDQPDGAAVSVRYASPSLSFDPATDEGASSVITVFGDAFASDGSGLGPVSSSVRLTVTGNSFRVVSSHTGAGSGQEWAAVMSGGVEVARAPVGPGGVVVLPPVGEPQGMAINEKGLPGCKPAPNGKTPFLVMRPEAVEAKGINSPNLRGVDADIRLMRTGFVGDRLFVIGGAQQQGDELVTWCESSTGTFDGRIRVSSTSDRFACPNPASALSSVEILDVVAAGGDPIGPDVSGSTGLSSAHTCVSVPFLFTRSDATPVRAFSVTFHLSPELALCAGGVTEGDYLSSVAGTQMFVTNHGGGSYTVDCGIFGPVCGATGDGTLFSLALSSTVQSAGTYGTITVDSVRVRDCSNAVVAADAGGTGYVPIVTTAPPAVTTLTATTLKTGNTAPAGGLSAGAIAGIVVAKLGASTKQYVDDAFRAPFGNYPLYDHGSTPGHAPSPPASEAAALAAGWTPVTCGSSTCSNGVCSSATCTATGMLDLPPSRDFYSYVVFVRDAFGNTSPCSNVASALDYHLGDVSDGTAVCSGDNHVDILDVSALGAHYGSSVVANAPWSCLDTGPTTDFSVDGRPTPDGRIEFEDFMMFALNFSVVSAPSAASRPAPAAFNATRLVVPQLPAVGQTFDVGVNVDGAGDIAGLSARLAFDANVIEQVGVAAGSLLEQQGRTASVLSSGPGDVDAALLGAGPGIAGSGEVARVTFRVKAAGDPGLSLAGITARDASNHPVPVTGAINGGGLPAHTALGFAYPNPFRQAVGVQLSLKSTGAASVAVFDVAGRRVRTLVQGVQPAGSRIVAWDGRDDAGLQLAPGAYIVRLETAGVRESRTVRLVR